MKEVNSIDSNRSSSESGGSSPSDEAAPPEPDSDEQSRQFVLLALFFEGGLAFVGVMAGVWSGLEWGAMVQLTAGSFLLGVGGGLGLFGLHFLLLFPGGNRNPLYRHIYKPLRHFLLPRLPDIGIGGIVLIAMISGLGEEILFRGWLQTQTDIVVASVLFGVVHIWGKEGIPYGLYAIGMGFVLGGLFEYTGRNLWAPVLAHAVNNLLGFLALKYRWFPEASS